MLHSSKRRLLSAGCLLTAALAACVGDDSGQPKDGGNDAVTQPDSSSDAPSDAITDGASDVAQDAPKPVPKAVGDFAWAASSNGTSTGPIAYDSQGNLYFAFQIYSGFPVTLGGKTYSSAGTYDVLLTKWSSTGKLVWVHQYGGTGDDQILALATDPTDPTGAVYATFLSASPSFSLGGPIFTHVGASYDGFVAKLDGSSGNATWMWNYTLATEGYPACGYIAFGGGRLAMACTAQKGLSFQNEGDGGTLLLSPIETGTGAGNFYVVSLDPTNNGKAVWGNVLATDDGIGARSIAVDSKGAAIVAFQARTAGSVVHDQTYSVNWTYAGADFGTVLVAKLASTNGIALWFQHFTGASIQNIASPGGIAVDGNDDIILGGQVFGQVPFGSFTLTSVGQDDPFVVKLGSSSGGAQWATSFGGSGDDHWAFVAVDAWNEVFFASTGASANGKLGSLPLPDTSSKTGIWLGKLDPTGAPLWATGVVGAGLWGGVPPIVADPSSGKVTIVGQFQGTVDLGDGTPITSLNGQEEVFAVTHNP